MSVKDAVNGQVDRAKDFVERLRCRYLNAYAAAVEGSSERLSDLARLSESLKPGLRDMVTEQIDSLQRRLDELNRSLADKAVPRHRKAKVGEMSLKEKARLATQAGQSRPLKVVGEASSVGAESATTVGTVAAGAKNKPKSPKAAKAGSPPAKAAALKPADKTKAKAKAADKVAGESKKPRTRKKAEPKS